MASISELSGISQIVQLENQDIIVLDTTLDIISYVHQHDKTTEVLMCKGAGCCSAFGSEQCYQSYSSDIGGITVNLKKEHALVYYSDKTTVKKFQISSQHIQTAVVFDLVNHVGSIGKIETFTFNKDYSIIFLLWQAADENQRMLYRYYVSNETLSGNIPITKPLTQILSLSEHIILGVVKTKAETLVIDFQSKSKSRVCRDTAAVKRYSGGDHLPKCTNPLNIKKMAEDDTYIYAEDKNETIRMISSIKGMNLSYYS